LLSCAGEGEAEAAPKKKKRRKRKRTRRKGHGGDRAGSDPSGLAGEGGDAQAEALPCGQPGADEEHRYVCATRSTGTYAATRSTGTYALRGAQVCMRYEEHRYVCATRSTGTYAREPGLHQP